MKTLIKPLLALTALCPVTAALAESSIASSASNSVSTSVGSASTSIEKSSESSTGGNKRVAVGDYRLIELAELPERPGQLRLRLQALAQGAGEFYLLLPRQTAEQGALARGQVVTARERPYGIEFARADLGQAFFLVLDDAWHRELQSRPVVL